MISLFIFASLIHMVSFFFFKLMVYMKILVSSEKMEFQTFIKERVLFLGLTLKKTYTSN